jgi:hypothetical protein
MGAAMGLQPDSWCRADQRHDRTQRACPAASSRVRRQWHAAIPRLWDFCNAWKWVRGVW